VFCLIVLHLYIFLTIIFFTLSKENYSNTFFTPPLWGCEDNEALNLTLFPHTCSGGNLAFLEISLCTLPISRKNFRGKGGYCSKTDTVFTNQYACYAESKGFIIKSCSLEKIHFQVVKFV
jgi:hypothetical protein